MISHPDIEAYILGDEDEREAVEAHIAGCEECMNEVAREARLELLLHAAGREDGFAAVVEPVRARRWPLVAAAAVSIAAVAVAYAVWPSGTTSGEKARRVTSFAATSPSHTMTAGPAWANGIKPGTARCSGSGGDLTCAASSGYRLVRDEAQDEAADVATEALAELALLRGGEPIRAQRALYRGARSAALALPDAEATRRALHEVASRVQLGRRDTWYWEEYARLDGPGTEFRVFVRFTAGQDEIADFLARYQARTAEGAELVPIIPGVRWALDPGEQLAFFVYRPSKLAEHGIGAGDVLLMDQRLNADRMRTLVESDRVMVWRAGLEAPVPPSKLR